MWTGYLKNERGVALLITLLMMVVFSIIGLGVLSMSTDEMRLVQNYEAGTRAFYLAEAGINEAIAQLQQNTDFLGDVPVQTQVVAQNGREFGRYKAHISNKSVTEVVVSATGQSNNITRQIEVTAKVAEGKLTFANYAVYGGKDVTLGTNFSASYIYNLLANLFGHSIFGVNGNIFAFDNVRIGPMYKIQGNVNSGGNTILDGYQLNLLFTQLQFGQAMISDTANSHTGIDTDNY